MFNKQQLVTLRFACGIITAVCYLFLIPMAGFFEPDALVLGFGLIAGPGSIGISLAKLRETDKNGERKYSKQLSFTLWMTPLTMLMVSFWIWSSGSDNLGLLFFLSGITLGVMSGLLVLFSDLGLGWFWTIGGSYLLLGLLSLIFGGPIFWTFVTILALFCAWNHVKLLSLFLNWLNERLKGKDKTIKMLAENWKEKRDAESAETATSIKFAKLKELYATINMSDDRRKRLVTTLAVIAMVIDLMLLFLLPWPVIGCLAGLIMCLWRAMSKTKEQRQSAKNPGLVMLFLGGIGWTAVLVIPFGVTGLFGHPYIALMLMLPVAVLSMVITGATFRVLLWSPKGFSGTGWRRPFLIVYSGMNKLFSDLLLRHYEKLTDEQQAAYPINIGESTKTNVDDTLTAILQILASSNSPMEVINNTPDELKSHVKELLTHTDSQIQQALRVGFNAYDGRTTLEQLSEDPKTAHHGTLIEGVMIDHFTV